MTLIKATDVLATRARTPAFRQPVPTPFIVLPDPQLVAMQESQLALETERSALEAEVAALKETLKEEETRRDDQLARMQEEMAEAVAEARAAGRAEGAAQKGESLAVLESATIEAVDDFRAALRGLECLAITLSKAALARVFGDHQDVADQVARLIRHQLTALDRDALLWVEVSSTDFADAAALSELSGQIGAESVELRGIDDLPPGGCRIRLRLGELDVGLDQQWRALSGLLDEAIAAGEAS